MKLPVGGRRARIARHAGTLGGGLRLVAIAAILITACDGSRDRDRRLPIGMDDSAQLDEVRALLPAASTTVAEIAAGTRPCISSIPSFPGCVRDHGQVLLLASLRYGGAGSRVDGLLWVPAGRRARLAMTLWHVDSLGTSLGAGWYRVVAISHVD